MAEKLSSLDNKYRKRLWSKYGGGTKNSEEKETISEWYCQSCGMQQPLELKPFLFEWPENEWIRICSICYHNKQGTLVSIVGKAIEIL